MSGDCLQVFFFPNFNWLSHQSQFVNLKTANLHFHLQQIIQNALKKEERKQVNAGRQAFVEILTLKFIAKQNKNPTYLSAMFPKTHSSPLITSSKNKPEVVMHAN
jgi:4'-phosphopantetheinyl transferase EntD